MDVTKESLLEGGVFRCPSGLSFFIWKKGCTHSFVQIYSTNSAVCAVMHLHSHVVHTTFLDLPFHRSGLLDPISALKTTMHLDREDNYLVWDTVYDQHFRDWVLLMSRYTVTGNKARVG